MIFNMKLRRLAPLILIAASLLVSACALPAPAPVGARLSQQALRVEMSNGAVCSAALTGDAPWRGDLADCGLSYQVTPTTNGSPIRLAFDALIASARAGNLVAPLADIILTDGTGRPYSFASPIAVDP